MAAIRHKPWLAQRVFLFTPRKHEFEINGNSKGISMDINIMMGCA